MIEIDVNVGLIALRTKRPLGWEDNVHNLAKTLNELYIVVDRIKLKDKDKE